jgi:RuvB-like protein 1 (pontin 52)
MLKKSWHSHINGIGHSKLGVFNEFKTGLIGDNYSRNSFELLVNLIKKNKERRVIILTGASGSGKNALALSLAKEIGPNIPFYSLNSSEINSSSLKKNSIITQYARMAIGLKIEDNMDLYEGELIDILIDKFNERNKLKNLTNIIITLKASEGILRLKLHQNLCKDFLQNKYEIGDILKIIPEKKIIKKVGRSKNFTFEKTFKNEKYITIPSGKVYKKKNIIQRMTFYDIDCVNLQYFKKFFSKKIKNDEIIGLCVDNMIFKQILHKKTEIIPGILLIDDIHILDSENLLIINKILESNFSPLFILATNRINIINLSSLFERNIFFDFIKKCLTVTIKQIKQNDLFKIISVKAKDKKIVLSGLFILNCGKIIESTSLRFVILLLNISRFFLKFSIHNFINFNILSIVNFFFFHYRQSIELLNFGHFNLKVYKIY